MWKCKKCHEQVEDSFEVCWNCGTSQEGIEDAAFRKEADITAVEGEPFTTQSEERKQSEEREAETVDFETEMARKFRCPKCKNRGASVKRFAATGTGLSRLLDFQHNEFIAVSCTRCTFTELYNPQIVESKASLMNVLDALFGG